MSEEMCICPFLLYPIIILTKQAIMAMLCGMNYIQNYLLMKSSPDVASSVYSTLLWMGLCRVRIQDSARKMKPRRCAATLCEQSLCD